ncbi:hypothetical protein MPK67_gp260 [Erwinia phage pEa_SNUABM_32]|uniref:Uncharacterized protein n=1 Tax=Erwinia phage pEa_SNUABM_32 TaxID=2869555 RepID=A0AAE8C396_9CAUD|nr:hypothetical protein MPK67_gp260 [Erwinia phage pEa_SNUABM_32]QZE57133.1 hypothetical protein pEaSNUABM32_00260 [Erwinia phage pEa_SNUABM_32]
MIHYTREELEEMDVTELDAIANSRNLLDDFDEEDDQDEHMLVGLILDDQNEQRMAEEDAADKQRAEDDRDPRINRREDQDGSDDYC